AEGDKVSSSSSVIPFATTISVTTGLPSVMVPVLSNTIVSSLCVVSSATPLLMRTPFSAPLPVPIMIDVGVARPSAQGQATTSIVMKIVSENITDSLLIYHANPDII